MNTKKASWFKRHKILTGFLIFFGFIIVMAAISPAPEGGSTTATNNATPEPTIEVTADDLFLAYENNGVAADSQYGGKTVVVTGTVDGIGKDILDSEYVTLRTSNGFSTVQCFLKNSEVSKAASLAKGSNVKLKGRVDDYLINVIVRSCEIL